ncbi:MAG: type pilus assembly ATPase PilB [Pseudomonadota bacterium]|jgi:type IV pilus assembly protein PilB
MSKAPETAVNLIDDMLDQGLTRGASDIHFESGKDIFRVRFRIDGSLHVAATPAVHLRDAIVSRLKVLARMDIAEKRLPQDGRIQYVHKNESIDLRVSSLPTVHGEKIVVRILNFNRVRLDLNDLGYEADDQIKLRQAIQRPHGLILMTGPTGSGKTSSLYSCLELINRACINLATIEDPSEIQLAGANQISINEKTGLTFASALRALLRQDPDVIMIGEIRDLETAGIAIQASQTGHLVFSTLHTNDAPSTLARLRHMGIPTYQIAASLTMVTAQRLVRRLCAQCKEPLNPQVLMGFIAELTTQDTQTIPSHMLSSPTVYKPVGCSACDNGYRGRIGLFQIMPISSTMQALIICDADAQALADQATREGVRTLRQAGWLKVLQGLTAIEEVMAFTAHD